MSVVDREGCFVFQVVGAPIRARSKPTTAPEDRTRLEFQPGELVSADLIHDVDHSSKTTSFCRLTDRTGWLFTKQHAQLRLEALETKTGLWALYIDSMSGQFLRRHPVASQDLSYNTHYKYMQKVFCDSKVSHPTSGVTFYRVQGTHGWLADRLPEGKRLLVSCDHVQKGYFAYRVLADLPIRTLPSVDLANVTRDIILHGETIICDLVLLDVDGGPFMKLVDGSGWICEQKSGQKMIEPVIVRNGSWEFRVKNPPVGVGLRTHPSDSQSNLSGKIFPPGSIVQCDRAISNINGVMFYRVTETSCWIFDRRGDCLILELLSSSESKPSRDAQVSWQPDFVRGILATVPSVTEMSYDATTGTMVVETGLAQLHIYCQTRMIGVLTPGESRQQCQRNCNVGDLMARLRDEPIVSSDEEEKKEEDCDLDNDTAIKEQEELQARKDLLQCDFEIMQMKDRRTVLLYAVQAYEEGRKTDTPHIQHLQGRASTPDIQDESRSINSFQPLSTRRRGAEVASDNNPEKSVRNGDKSTIQGEQSGRQSWQKVQSIPNGLPQDGNVGKSVCHAMKHKCNKLQDHVVEPDQGTQRTTPYNSASESSLTEADRSGPVHNRRRSEKKPVQDMHPDFFTSPMYSVPVSTATSNIATACPPATGSRRKSGGSRLSQRRSSRGMFSCGECNDRFESIESRDLHCASVHKTQCSHCRRILKSFAALDQHLQTEHLQ